MSNISKGKEMLSLKSFAASSVALAACLGMSGCGSSETGFSADSPNPDATVNYREASWILDPNDKVALAEWADEIFTGTVVELSGSETEDPDFPRTGYEVAVEDAIDGTPPDTVLAIQDGGYTDDGEELLLFTGDQILEPGAEHLFVAKVVDGSRLLFPIVGSEELETPEEAAAVEAEYIEAVEEAEAAPAEPTK